MLGLKIFVRVQRLHNFCHPVHWVWNNEAVINTYQYPWDQSWGCLVTGCQSSYRACKTDDKFRYCCKCGFDSNENC